MKSKPTLLCKHSIDLENDPLEKSADVDLWLSKKGRAILVEEDFVYQGMMNAGTAHGFG